MSKLVPGLVIAQKYKLDRVLARGGMGSVWIAQNTHLKIPVAIKFMTPSTVGSAELVTRFEREATAAAQVRSPHVVQIFEHGVDRDAPYIVMELLEGESLGARLKRAERLSIEETARVVSGVCKALRRAHELGVIHRDLKPANIFLARHDDEEVVKVLDFGIAKCLTEAGSGITKTGQIVGTAQYMSPEQVQCSRALDHRSDLWSLGIIAFRALTGSVPFRNASAVDTMIRIFTEPAPPPSSLAPELGPEVDRFFARALAIAPDGRFQSAREMADAMSALAGRVSLADTSASDSSSGDAGEPPREPAQGREEALMDHTMYTALGGTEPLHIPPAAPLPRPDVPPREPPTAPVSPAPPPLAVPLAAPLAAPPPWPTSQPLPVVPRGSPMALGGDLFWVTWVAAGAGLLVVAVVAVALLVSG